MGVKVRVRSSTGCIALISVKKIYKRKTKTNMEELIKLLQEEKEKGSEVMALTLVIKRDYRLYAVSCNSSNEITYQELL